MKTMSPPDFERECDTARTLYPDVTAERVRRRSEAETVPEMPKAKRPGEYSYVEAK